MVHVTLESKLSFGKSRSRRQVKSAAISTELSSMVKMENTMNTML